MPHGHACPNPRCGRVWIHVDHLADVLTDREYDDEHRCPNCGAVQKVKMPPTDPAGRATYTTALVELLRGA